VLASAWSDGAIVSVSILALLVSLVALWFNSRSTHAAAESAEAAARAARAAKEQAAAQQEAAHHARTPRLELRLGIDHGNDTVEVELINRGPVVLDRIDYEIASRWTTHEVQPGSLRRHDTGDGSARNVGAIGPLRVGEARELEATRSDFWLRLTCTAPDGEQWTLSLEVPAASRPIGHMTSTIQANE
jgi:type II secretory pathway pseudopilin PulG